MEWGTSEKPLYPRCGFNFSVLIVIRATSIIALLLLISPLDSSAGDLADVAGWGSLRWGASVSELTEHLGRFPTASNKDFSEFGCDEYYEEYSVEYLGLQFDWVSFCFKDGKLSEVALSAYLKEAQKQDMRVKMLAKLEEAYGPPMYSSEGKNTVSVDPHRPVGAPTPPIEIWQFKSTRIMHRQDEKVLVTYEPIGAKPDFDANMEMYLRQKEEGKD